MFNKITFDFKQDSSVLCIHFYMNVDSISSSCFIMVNPDYIHLKPDLPDNLFAVQVFVDTSIFFYKVLESAFNQLSDFLLTLKP